VLIIYDEQNNNERIQLAPYSTDELHELVKEKGFSLKVQSSHTQNDKTDDVLVASFEDGVVEDNLELAEPIRAKVAAKKNIVGEKSKPKKPADVSRPIPLSDSSLPKPFVNSDLHHVAEGLLSKSQFVVDVQRTKAHTFSLRVIGLVLIVFGLFLYFIDKYMLDNLLLRRIRLLINRTRKRRRYVRKTLI